ncbi:protein CNPPD1 isoform X1 [Anopheles darlingi]|uniref:protein CNPPD1 isoform X1 n=1 Tax=Anopheles darlingi TaxID=43151 RepID=UPI0021000311|nr:protein CNPPD1 isoform X1 [Anopheles darlingi]
MMIECEQPNISNSQQQVLDHEEFLDRIKKTLYYGSSKVRCTKISRPLADYAADVFSESHRGHSLSRLNFATVGSLSVTPCSLILAMIYLDRLNATDPTFVRRVTPSELFIVSMMVSTKFYCGYDEDVYLSAWAESGNMTPEQMKSLELEFLDAMNWNAYVSKNDFFAKLKSVEKVLAKRQGLSRGWLTYTELINFLPSFAIAKQLIQYSTIMALSYTASVMTIAGAFLLASNLQLPHNLLYRGTARTCGELQASGPHKLPTSSQAQQPLGRCEGLVEGGTAGLSNNGETNLLEDCTMDGPIITTTAQTEAINATLKDCEKALASEYERKQQQLLLNEHHWHGTKNHQTHLHTPYRYPNIRFIYDSTGGSEFVPQIDFLHSDEVLEHKPNQQRTGIEQSLGAAFSERDDLQGSLNCSYDYFIPLAFAELQASCVAGGGGGSVEHDTTNGGGVYHHYKRTYDMLSSLLKFL